jgi:NADP-reducing hydrogenase subunit HndD
MCCPGGCITGGGQPIVDAKTQMSVNVRELRAKVLYGEDASKAKRKSHENAEVQQLYKEFLGEPNSHKAHELLHTTYSAKPKFKK